MLVDGSEPGPVDAPATFGVLWLPRTAVGEGGAGCAAVGDEADGAAGAKDEAAGDGVAIRAVGSAVAVGEAVIGAAFEVS